MSDFWNTLSPESMLFKYVDADSDCEIPYIDEVVNENNKNKKKTNTNRPSTPTTKMSAASTSSSMVDNEVLLLADSSDDIGSLTSSEDDKGIEFTATNNQFSANKAAAVVGKNNHGYSGWVVAGRRGEGGGEDNWADLVKDLVPKISKMW